MKLSLYIAKRYLFAKKSRNAINIISAVSVAGVAVGTMALIIILSVFNGLEMMVTSIFNTFDPDLKDHMQRKERLLFLIPRRSETAFKGQRGFLLFSHH